MHARMIALIRWQGKSLGVGRDGNAIAGLWHRHNTWPQSSPGRIGLSIARFCHGSDSAANPRNRGRG
jgi:hypothetical protein